VMKKTGKQPDLIRYDSAEGIEKGHISVWNWRNRAYSVVLLILFSVFVYTLLSRTPVETTILRTPGLIYQENSDGTISNVYNIKIINKTHRGMELELKPVSYPDGVLKMAGNHISVSDQDMFESTFVLFLPREEVKSEKMIISFGIYFDGKLLETTETTFVGPPEVK
jgi:polyferredoxin